jgi:hypothetical protein
VNHTIAGPAHECCESCVQDIEAGYGDDLIYLGICCCEAENPSQVKP